MELCRLLEEPKARVAVHHVLDQRDKVLRHEEAALAPGREKVIFQRHRTYSLDFTIMINHIKV